MSQWLIDTFHFRSTINHSFQIIGIYNTKSKKVVRLFTNCYAVTINNSGRSRISHWAGVCGALTQYFSKKKKMKPCRAHCNKKLKLFVTGYWIFCTVIYFKYQLIPCNDVFTLPNIKTDTETETDTDQWRIQECPGGRERQPLSLGQNLLFSNIFAKRCIKLNKLDLERAFLPPPRSTNADTDKLAQNPLRISVVICCSVHSEQLS